MKKTLLLGASLLCSVFIMATEIPFQKAEIKSIMRKVADWQIANPHPAPEHDDLNWPQGALYVGMVDWAELAEKEDNDDTYYKWLTRIGQRNCWQPDKRFYHADDIAVSQSFLDLYRKYKDEAMIIPTLARTEWIVNHPSEGSFKLVEGDLKTLERLLMKQKKMLALTFSQLKQIYNQEIPEVFLLLLPQTNIFQCNGNLIII